MNAGELEVTATLIAPYFDAIRDTFASFSPEPGILLRKICKVDYLIEPAAHDTERHFAGCRQDGRLIVLAPEIVDLEEENLVAIIAHEFGHAADFSYPGFWVTSEDPHKPAIWIGDRADKMARRWHKHWHERSSHEQEVAADAIVKAVTGKSIGYCGKLKIQCFAGEPRPRGLR